MLKIALTGGIATGKSYVLDQFRRRGVPCLDADVLAHGVTAPGTEATAAIAARFGADVLGADGAVDRAKLGPIVFADAVGAPRARSDRPPGGLPRDRRRACAAFELIGDSPFAVVDVPLLFETGARARLRPRHRHRVRAGDADRAAVGARGLTRSGRAPAPRGAVADRRESRARATS